MSLCPASSSLSLSVCLFVSLSLSLSLLKRGPRPVSQRVLVPALRVVPPRSSRVPGCKWVTIYVTCRNKRQRTKETHGVDISIYKDFLFAPDASVNRGILLHPDFLYATTTDASCSQFNAMNFRSLPTFRRIKPTK